MLKTNRPPDERGPVSDADVTGPQASLRCADCMVETPRWCCSMWTLIESIVVAMSRCTATDDSSINISRSAAALMRGIAVEPCDADVIHM
jgi:hypothetical protein